MKQEEDNPRLKEWKRKLAEGKKNLEPPKRRRSRKIVIEDKDTPGLLGKLKRLKNDWIGTPKSHKGGDWDRVGRILGLIVLFNLIAFCAVMLVVDISLFTKPTVVPPGEAPTVFDRAQKYD